MVRPIQAPVPESLHESLSPAYIHALARAEKFARDLKIPILIEGESGTGKTHFAQHIHRRSPRANEPYQIVNLGVLDDGLASAELFGYVPGAFTGAGRGRPGLFQSAHQGTIVLDEIGKASRLVQQKLLDAIEYGRIRQVGADRDFTVDVRVIAATNVPLGLLVEQEQFLNDLYARIATCRIWIPPLRERKADIPMLVREAIQRHAGSGRAGPIPVVDPPLMEALQDATWPNNLRELDATIHLLVIESDGAPVITLDHMTDVAITPRSQKRAPLTNLEVAEALRESKNNKSEAARRLRVHRSTIHRHSSTGEDPEPSGG